MEALIKYADVNQVADCCDNISERLRGCPEDALGFAVAGVDFPRGMVGIGLDGMGRTLRPADMYQVNSS